MNKKHITIAGFLLITIIVLFNIVFEGAEHASNTIADNSLTEFEQDGSSVFNDETDGDFSAVQFSAEDFNDNNTMADKLAIIQVALQSLNNQNRFLQKQLDLAEKKTVKINTELNNLSDKINAIPVSESAITAASKSNNAINLSSVSKEVIELCQDQMVQLSQQRKAQDVDVIAQKLDTEAIDSQWSDDIDSMLSSLIRNNNLVGSGIELVSCRTSVCEVVIKHKDYQSLMGFNSKLPSNLKYQFPNDSDDILTENFFILRNATAVSYND